MNYSIIYDKKGRLRLRCGQRAFSKKQGYGITDLLRQLPGVKTAYASVANGGLLIDYHGDCRDQILSCISSLEKDPLPFAEGHATEASREIGLRLQDHLISGILRRFLIRYLLPSPVRMLLTLIQAKSFVSKGLKAISQGNLNVEVLDGAAISAALLQRDFRSAASIMFLLSISDALSEYTQDKARDALQQSLVMNVDQVWIKKAGVEVQIPLSQLQCDDCLCIRTGSMIPVDGRVVEGYGTVNEAAMTGESQGVEKGSGSLVYAGTVVAEGSLVICVKALPQDTRLQQIINLVQRAESLKADIQSKAEHLADAIVPFSFLTFFATLLVTRRIRKALSVLMVDYSCAIKLSTPICILSAMKEAASHHILVKGGKFLEQFAAADTLVFDKTGTLTHAVPAVTGVISVDHQYKEDEVLRIAACLEEHFPHSVARAIVAKAAEKNLRHPEDHAQVEYVVAHGIVSSFRGERALVGSAHFVFEDEGIPYLASEKKALEKKLGHRSPVYVALGGKLIGVICIEDPPRPEAACVIEELRKLNFRHIVMLTGDSDRAASAVCRDLRIDEYRAQVLPEEKSRIIEEMRSQGRTVVMVGDGINDSPALACAHVSVAMKDASDLARETADITLLNSSLEELVALRRLSVSLMRRIRGNYSVIVGFNTGLLILGLGGIITPAASAWLHNSSTMLLALSSMQAHLPTVKK